MENCERCGCLVDDVDDCGRCAVLDERARVAGLDDTIARLTAALATAEREREEARRVVALVWEAALPGTPLDASDSGDDRIICQVDGQRTLALRAVRAEAERDAAIAERDARPDISAEDAAFLADLIWSYRERGHDPEGECVPLRERLRAHATKHRTESEG